MSDCPIFDETQAALDMQALAQYRIPDIRAERRTVAEVLRVEVRDQSRRLWLVLAAVAAVLVLLALLVVTL